MDKINYRIFSNDSETIESLNNNSFETLACQLSFILF